MLKINCLKLSNLIFAGALLCSTPLANAHILEGNFNGSIFESFDQYDYFGLGAGDNTLIGETVSGSFTINTDLIPSDINANLDHGEYQENGNDQWFTFELTTSFGHAWSSAIINSINDGNRSDIDTLSIRNNFATESTDSLQLVELSQSDTNIWRTSLIALILTSTNGSGSYFGQDFLINDELPLMFDKSNYDLGRAEGVVIDSNFGTDLNIRYNFSLDSISWGLPTTNVPESSPILLMLIGILSLFISRIRRAIFPT